MTTTDVAKRLGVTSQTVRKYILDGYLEAFTQTNTWLVSAEAYRHFKKTLWRAFERGKHGRPKGKQREMTLNQLALELEKLTGHRR
jgi:predicted transcriptional regulator